MVDSKRSSRGSWFSLKPRVAAALAGNPPLGYQSPPTLIGWKTITPSVLALRAKNYAAAYKICTMQQWNTYITFGIQDFISAHDYFTQWEADSPDERKLRVARCYRRHLETQHPVDPHLLISIPAVEDTLRVSHPGFLYESE
jgi:hypothetical protein